MQRKPQQQTLSIRISNTLREFLEQSQQVISSGGRESVSISDVAKTLLESAKDDRLDFRLEVAELLRSSAESLCRIRGKWSASRRSRAQNGFCLVITFRWPVKSCRRIPRCPAHVPSPL